LEPWLGFVLLDSLTLLLLVSGFDFPALSFIRARHDGENFVDIRKELPANDSCVPSGEYTYFLEQGCSCEFFTDCQNDVIVVVENHTVACTESGLPTEMAKEEFESYFSELDYYRDCCEEEMFANTKIINFSAVAVGSTSSPQTVEITTSSCSSMPRDMAPDYSFLNESQSVFTVEKGESSESFIPRGHGNSEFIFSFTPPAVGDYNETIVFKKFMIEVEVQLSGRGVDAGDSVVDSDSAQAGSSGCTIGLL
jgi:hypothetical protein